MARIRPNSIECLRQSLRCLVRVVSWLPVVFVTMFIIWVYYVAVFIVMIFQGPGLPDKPLPVRVILLVGGHILLFLLFSTYMRAIFARHKKIPNRFKLTNTPVDSPPNDENLEQSLVEGVAANLPVYTISRSGGVRWCRECRVVKPDRCHHCSSCQRCVLKMDHHCPWVNNCVGYSNYKFFLLFLFYTVFVCVYIDLATGYDFVSVWTTLTDIPSNNATSSGQFEYYWAKFNVVFMFFLVACFGIATSVLLFFHVYLVCSNKTTIENMEPVHLVDGKDRRLYNLGARENLRQVFGSNLLLAFLPVFTSEGDGTEFKMRRAASDLAAARMRWSTRRERFPRPSADETEDETSETQPLRH